jgi:hypothetical protein
LEWRPAEEAERHLAMMSPVNLKKVEAARAEGRPIVGAFYRRIRSRKTGPKSSALKSGLTGWLVIVDGPSVRMRPLAPREYARCMGVPDSYCLPGNVGEARSLMGDGICVPLVRWFAKQVIEPRSKSRAGSGRHWNCAMAETRETFLAAAHARCLAAIKAAKINGRVDRPAIRKATNGWWAAFFEAERIYRRDVSQSARSLP